MWVRRLSRDAPFACLQHRGLVVFGDGLITPLAKIGGGLGIALLPTQELEFEPVHMAAMRTRHKEPALIACLEFALNPGQALDRGRRDEKQFLAMSEGCGSGLGQGDGIALAIDIAWEPAA